jgi:hypothetical protein
MKQVRPIKMCLNEVYSSVQRYKHVSDNFCIQNGLKQGDALVLFYFSFIYAIKMIQESHVVLKRNGTHQPLAYADDVNLLGANNDTLKNTNKQNKLSGP